MNPDLFLAILSMDSYNRGYGRGIKFSSADTAANKDEIGTKIGAAFITKQDNSEGAISAGFYALSYNWNGETIIAYRGSDKIEKGVGDVIDLLIGGGPITDNDLTSGYGVALGRPLAPQGQLAMS
jgi:hypothetical protein